MYVYLSIYIYICMLQYAKASYQFEQVNNNNYMHALQLTSNFHILKGPFKHGVQVENAKRGVLSLAGSLLHMQACSLESTLHMSSQLASLDQNNDLYDLQSPT